MNQPVASVDLPFPTAETRLGWIHLLGGDVSKFEIERRRETIEVWNVCECGRILHSMAEGKRGTCSGCWIKSMPKDTKTAMNKMIGAAFRDPPPGDAEKGELITNAMDKLNRDAETVYVMVEVGNPAHAVCRVLRGKEWMIPNMSHDDLIAVEQERPDEVKWLGDNAEIDHPVIPKAATRWQSFVYALTGDAYKACEEKWESRRSST